ncbi:MAG: sensor histidine kinase [Cyclobacteriaceae bacterium]
MFSVKYRYIYIILLGVYSYFNIIFTGADSLLQSLDVRGYKLLLVLLFVVVLIWEGNRIIQRQLELKKSQFKKPYQPLLILFFLSLVNVIVVTLIPLMFIELFNWKVTPLWLHIKLLLGFGFRVNLFLNSINAIVYFLNLSKENQLQAEDFKKKSIEAQFEALRNQINPHFLFNSLNVLSTLVYKNANEADQFIQQLAKVYRYLINNQDKKIINLEEENSFIDSYIYLLNIRFKSNLYISKEFDKDMKNSFVAPATLQLLLENAINHNIVSHKNPLNISIRKEDDYIVVQNNLQLKPIQRETTRIGLSNIRNRYQFLSNKPVKIHKNDQFFTVKIPLIKITE